MGDAIVRQPKQRTSTITPLYSPRDGREIGTSQNGEAALARRLYLHWAGLQGPSTYQTLGIFIKTRIWVGADVLTSWMNEVKDEQSLQCQVEGDSMHFPTHWARLADRQ